MLRCLAISTISLLIVPRLAMTHEQTPYVIRDNVNLVLLDVSVRNPAGGYVSGLRENNFTVDDDGVKQRMTRFAAADIPITVGLVVDTSGSMRKKRPHVVMSGLEFAKSSNPKDEFFVVNFNDHVYFGLPKGTGFTDQLQSLRDALFLGRPDGQTALYDAISVGLKHLEQGHNDVRTLIVVSDGGDNVSKTSFAQLTRMIEASRATIYTIGLLDPDDQDLNPRVLRKIAALSGGEFFAPRELGELSPIFEKIASDLRNRYTLAFVPDQSLDKHTLHTLKVSARDNDGRKLIVHSRTSYLTAE